MTDRRALANHLYSEGYLLKEIAARLGVSHQRVSQLVTAPRRGRGNTRGKRFTYPASSPVAPAEAGRPKPIPPIGLVCPPRYFDPRAKATEVEPGTAVGTGPRKTINHRAGLRVGVAATRIAAEGEQAGNSLSRPHDFDPRFPEQAPEAEWKEGIEWNR